MNKPLFFRLVVFLMLLGFPSQAQVIRVIDEATALAIPNVQIYTHPPVVSAVTNNRGMADIRSFAGRDTLFFQHLSYRSAAFSHADLEAMNYVVILRPNKVLLDAVVISASRWEQEEKEIPFTIDALDRTEVAFRNPQTSADLLASGGYLFVQKSQYAGGSPMIRGFSTNRVMIVVDGVRMNNAIFRSGNLQNVLNVDAASVEKSEVLFGPGAVMYGSDAIGGVMDFRLLKPVFSKSNKLYHTGSVMARHSTASSEKTLHADISLGGQKLASLTSFSYSDFSDLQAGTIGNAYFLRPIYQETVNGEDRTLPNSNPSKQIHSGFGMSNFIQKISYKPVDSLLLNYSLYVSTVGEAPRYDRLTLTDGTGKLVNAEWYYGPQKWIMNRLQADLSKPTRLLDELKFTAAYQLFEESRHDRKMHKTLLRNQFERVDAFSLNLDINKRLNAGSRLYYGVEGIHNLVGSRADRTPVGGGEPLRTATRYPDGSTWNSYAAYLNLVSNLTEKWLINAGARYSYVTSESVFDTTLFAFPFTSASVKNGALNGSLGLTFHPTENVKLYSNLSTGFRAPNIDDLGKVFESEPGSVVVPNKDLKPEYAWNAEAGSQFFKRDLINLDISVFYTWLNDAITRRPFSYNGQTMIDYDGVPSRVLAMQNASHAYVYGLQAGVNLYLLPELELTSKLVYQYGREYDADSSAYYPLRHVPPTFGSTQLSWNTKKYRVDLTAEYNAEMPFHAMPLSEINDSSPYAKDESGNPFVPAWYTLNARMAWFLTPKVTLFGGIDNITDQLYRPYASGISAPGRNFQVSLKFNW